MMSFRPETGSRYLERLRLLDKLPQKPGFVVWLEAPYGYGKSVLASQWAASLEDDGWRTIWLAADSGGLRSTVAAGLALPADSPWEAVFDALWRQRTLLVIEDLENLQDHEELVPLLRAQHGLLLLASRGPLRTSEFPRLVTSGRLIHLRTAELGFSEEEVSELIPDPKLSSQLWRQTSGWPLPLHFAALTGSLPDGQQLLSGLRASVEDAEWHEILLLATVPDLPVEAATPVTAELARSGFVQHGAGGYRLHALAAEHIVASHAGAAGAALRQASSRLPELLYGEALEKLGDLAGLAELLDRPQLQLGRQSPETILRWDGLVPGPVSSLRHLSAGTAHTIMGHHSEAVNRFRAGLHQGGLGTADELFALKGLVWSLAVSDHAAAAEVVDRAEALLPLADPDLAGRFLMDASYADVVVGDYQSAIRKLERALDMLPADSIYRTGCHINLVLNRWYSLGDYDGRLAIQTSTLSDVWRLYPSDAPGQCRDIAMLHAWAGNRAAARRYLEEAISGERASPLVGLEVRAALAAFDGDATQFPELFSRALMWNNHHTLDLIAMYAIQVSPADAEYYYSQVPEPALATAAYARLHDDPAEALRLIDAALSEQVERAFSLYLLAARYSVSRSTDDLEAFMTITNAGARLLPGHVPISELPVNRPELARHYDISDVLASGWKEAIHGRLDELPDLQIGLLGQLRVQLAGQTVELSERPLQLLILLLLGQNREQAAEAIWPEASPAQQRNNLNVQLSTLRRTLEPWGTSHYLHDRGLRHVAADYLELTAALEQGDADTVLSLYREPVAPGVSLALLDEHRDWLHTRVVQTLLSAAESGGEQAGRLLGRVLELDPLNEEVLRRLLEHLLKRGRQREAERHYREFASRLLEETGLEPEAATTELLS